MFLKPPFSHDLAHPSCIVDSQDYDCHTDNIATVMSSNDDTKRLITLMQSSEALFDANHYHSFQSISFLLIPVYSCGGCGKRVSTSVWGSTRPLQCVACGCYSHRSCAFSTTLCWKEKCRVNSKKYMSPGTNDGTSNQGRQRLDFDQVVPGTAYGDDRENSTADGSLEELCSITATWASVTDSPIVKSTKSVDEILDGMQRYSWFMDMQNTRVDFPFRSTTHLFQSNAPDKVTSELMHDSVEATDSTIQNFFTNTESSDCLRAQNSSASTSLIELNSPWSDTLHPRLPRQVTTAMCCAEFTWTHAGPTLHWSNERRVAEIAIQAKQVREEKVSRDKDEPAGILQFGSGFRIVSQALQENIMVTFGRLVSRDENPDSQEPTIIIESSQDEEICAAVLSGGGFAQSAGHQDIHLLLEEPEPMQDSFANKQHLGFGYIAGGVAGGLVGLVLAGPAGGLIGMKFGQLGAIGMLLEGSLTVGAMAGGVAAGQNLGKHLDDRIKESRVLSLGDGTNRQLLLLVRPSIQPPDASWELIFQEARRTYSGGRNSFVQSLFTHARHVATRDRYGREVDIVEVAESELPTSDKVLLLVSRILNNKNSLAGHVYRYLVEAFRIRATQDCYSKLSSYDEHATMEARRHIISGDGSSMIAPVTRPQAADPIPVSSSTRTRQDTHAIIKYITAALLETRPGLGCSDAMTEMTATAVESFVFGEVYDMVIAEIIAENATLDDRLLTKIRNFELRMEVEEIVDITNLPNRFVCSNMAVEALRCLPEAHTAVDKLRSCVYFLEEISESCSRTGSQTFGADSLLPMVCQHIVAAKVPTINAEVSFLEGKTTVISHHVFLSKN
jgi:hypothetical protein